MYGQYVRSVDRQLVSEEDTFLRLSRESLKAEAEMIAAQGLALKQSAMQQNCYKRNQTANTDCVNPLTREYTTLSQRAHYWQKYNT
jgi:hypothetical protein